jgi:hypothetical protein
MGYSQYDPPMRARTAWNAGKTVGAKRPLTQKQVWAVRFFLDRESRLRDRALFDLAIDSKLRGCDLVRISIGDVAAGADIRTRAVVVQKVSIRRGPRRAAFQAASAVAGLVQFHGSSSSSCLAG